MKKCWEKIVGKSAKKRFLYSHDNHHQKMGEIRAKQFFQIQTNCASKKLYGKNRRKKVRNVFYNYTNIVKKNGGGGKTRETIFTEEHD